MKLNNLTTLTLALTLVVGANVAYAQDNTELSRPILPMPAREKMEEMRANFTERQNQAQEGREKARSEMELRRQEVKQNLLGRMASSTARKEVIAEKRAELRQAHMARLVENATKMLTVTSDRFTGIIERIESRIEKIQDAGGDTAAAESFVRAAKADLAEVKEAIANLPNIEITDSNSTSTPRNFEALRSAVKAVKEEMRSVHENLKSAVQSLKETDRPEADSQGDNQ